MNNIILFINSLSSGGAEHQLSILANFLAEKDYNVTIATISNEPDHYQLDSRVKREYIGGKNKIGKLALIWYYFLTVKTNCVIIFCQRNSLFALPALFLRSRKKVKVICGERNLTIGKQGRIEKILFSFLYRRANYIVPNSYSQSRYIERIAPWLKEKLMPITNYTSLDKFCYTTPPQNHPLKVGVFCRYEKQKNCIGFIDAVALVKRHSNIDFQIHWYGNRKFSNSELQNYYRQMENRIKVNRLQDVVYLHDATKNVSEKMSTVDAICLPSFFEGFSNTISEAICSGRPVLCSDVSDNNLMVKEGENGFLFDPNNIDSMSQAIISFISLPCDTILQMGLNSRLLAEGLFNKEKFISSYITIINNKT